MLRPIHVFRYVDQVGNGEQRNCGDPTHNHTVNGGSFWAEAFYGILKEVRAATPARSTMFMTEGIVEEVQGVGFDILLGEPPLTHHHNCLHSLSTVDTLDQHAVICPASHRLGNHTALFPPIMA